VKFQEPVTYPDMGIWHPLAPSMFEDVKEYLNWYNSRKDIPADLKTPCLCVGLVLQRTHLVTGDDAHYGNGAGTRSNGRTGDSGLCRRSISKPVDAYFYDQGTALSKIQNSTHRRQ